MSAAPGPAASPPLTQTRSFWAVMAYAVVLGVLGAAAGLLFIGVIGFGDNWYVDPTPGWFNCQWWWIAVTAGAGVIVGVLRRLTHLPDKTAGLIADLQDEHTSTRDRSPGSWPFRRSR